MQPLGPYAQFKGTTCEYWVERDLDFRKDFLPWQVVAYSYTTPRRPIKLMPERFSAMPDALIYAKDLADTDKTEALLKGEAF